MLTEATPVNPNVNANPSSEHPADSPDLHEIDFAHLTGYIDDAPSLDATELTEFASPEKHRTLSTLVSNPFSKIALVGGVGIIGFALVGL